MESIIILLDDSPADSKLNHNELCANVSSIPKHTILIFFCFVSKYDKDFVYRYTHIAIVTRFSTTHSIEMGNINKQTHLFIR